MARGDCRHHVTLDTPTGGPLDPPDWWCQYVDEGVGVAALIGAFHPGITLATRVVFKDHRYQVMSIDNRQERDRTLVLHVKEVFDDVEVVA